MDVIECGVDLFFFFFLFSFFFFNDTATTEIYTLSLHDALPILSASLQTMSVTLNPSLAARFIVMLHF